MRHMALGVPSDTMECTATQMYTAAKTPLVAHRYMMSLREKKGICAVQQYGWRCGTQVWVTCCVFNASSTHNACKQQQQQQL